MNSMSARPKPVESAISICLLAVLLLIAMGIFIKQASQPTDVKDSADVLSSMAPSGFEPFSQTETYTEENLYEKIDGKATFYTDAGFKELRSRRFTGKLHREISIELYVYDMQNTRNAFSVYSRQVRPDAQVLRDAQFGYRTTNALYIVHGRYYIEAICSAQLDELPNVVTELANNIPGHLDAGKITSVEDIRFLPTDNIIPLSIKLYLTDTFGYEGLTNTFTARYRIGNQTLTAFFSKRPGSGSAQQVAENYYNFLIENGGTAKQTKVNFGARAVDFYNTTEIVFAIGPFVGGIHEAEDQKTAEQMALILHKKLVGSMGVTQR